MQDLYNLLYFEYGREMALTQESLKILGWVAIVTNSNLTKEFSRFESFNNQITGEPIIPMLEPKTS